MKNTCEKWRKPVKVLQKWQLFVSPNIPILGCSPDAKVIDLSCRDRFGIGEVKCPSSKSWMSHQCDSCDDPALFMENKDGKPSRGHVHYDQAAGTDGSNRCQVV